MGMEMVRADELRGTEEGAKDEQKMGVTEQILGWLSNEVSQLSNRGSARYEIQPFTFKFCTESR